MNEQIAVRTTHKAAARLCVGCDAEIPKYCAVATVICSDCRIAKSPEKTCQFCQVKYKAPHAQSCPTCRRARHIYSNFGSGRFLAGQAVAKARIKNILPSPREFACVDCGTRATEYDHRDYSKPLMVEPVCRGCNARRGPAKRKDWSFDEFWTWLHQEYFQGVKGHKLDKANPISREQMMPVARAHWPELAY